ncbi:hypothetical protein H257_17463 [Aphanomyces astaci]|uniref:3-deoxy-D-manno-octulosonic-acid transferase N-terminal domain-containing protein n=1 Tax=Aphanomyces astaci TaxID=112090 RepID=W4FGB3_APHAT|nr:hypothetical protein H257_17463 [Aphanomyces astaci]ETV65909.1 hypothetical protein H257_17463 [Aphanomyces astaci]|eukprot:XP_009844564.1 hypothetical protein H257_17463 [Aphanomyces astaci]
MKTLVEIQVYRAVWTACWPIVRWLVRAKDTRRKVPASVSIERTGDAIPPDHFRSSPRGVVWIHGASVGECLSALPLIKVITDESKDASTMPPCQVLVTTTTPSARALLTQRLVSNPNAHCIFAPLDHAPCVRRFLDTWQPVAAIWIESELWPNMLVETSSRQISMALLNGRMSTRSFNRWNSWMGRRLARSLLSHFETVWCQSPQDMHRFQALGLSDTAKYIGDLKFLTTKADMDATSLDNLKRAVESRVVWTAASTHEGEEALVVEAHVDLLRRHPRLLLVLIPRHPHRVTSIVQAIQSKHPLVNVTLRSRHGVPEANSDVFIVDTMGETQMCYEVSRVAFVGGSLVPIGGHNVLEPLRSGCTVLHGPHMANFTSVVQTLGTSPHVVQVTASTLVPTLDRVFLEESSTRSRQLESLEPIQRTMWTHVYRFLNAIQI